jgi:hypothetical protein
MAGPSSVSFDLTPPKAVSRRAQVVFDLLDEIAEGYAEWLRRPLAQKLQGEISLSTEIRRERSDEILALPSDGVVLISRDSIINKLKRDANAAFPDDDEPEGSDGPPAMPPKRRPSRSSAQLQALQRENDRRHEVKLAKAIRGREAGTEG